MRLAVMVCSEQLGISFVLLQPTFTLSILHSAIHYQRGELLMVCVIYRAFFVESKISIQSQNQIFFVIPKKYSSYSRITIKTPYPDPDSLSNTRNTL